MLVWRLFWRSLTAVTQQPSDISALITAVKDFKNSMHTNIGTNNHTQNNATTTQTQNRRPRNPYKKQKYCWTHGAFSYTSKICTQRANGHKREATFSNMLRGSTNRCFWLPSTWRCGMVANEINTKNYSPTVIPSQPHDIADTGATGYYISPNHIHTRHTYKPRPHSTCRKWPRDDTNT